MEFNHYALGQKVRKFRRKMGLSQNEFSELIGRSTTFLSYVENGTKKMSIETFTEVAHALNMSMDELISGCVSGESKITSYDFSKILADCNEYEKHILADTLKAVKQSLKAKGRRDKLVKEYLNDLGPKFLCVHGKPIIHICQNLCHYVIKP